MSIIHFSVDGRDNCVTVAGTPYFYARTEHGSFVLPALCPHRGGPLHLADSEPGQGRLVCPWHGRATSVTRARTSGIPAVRRGDTVTAVFPGEDRYELSHVPVTDQLRWSGCLSHRAA